ncbi:hypothetical protein Lac2_03490 [Claveliimonas bilis]|uniref:hypothetical protein n=1 Tax=Claveliimonas bilis TaxID=3028070 RepID=UPI002930089C|nr:hypothetical protein [Claveliimonas bilis]BDZ82215.1 hypothetical protein Lac2_03490 [Claveliimonas bilis]
MKSRLIKAIGTALIAASCFGMTLLAAPSPSASTPVGDTATAVNANGEPVNVTVTSEIPAEYQAVVSELKSEAGFAKVMEELNLTEALGAAAPEDVMLLDVKEVTIAEEDLPATITFSVAGVNAQTKGMILHYSSAKNAWETIETQMGEGTMAGTFESLSPVAFVIDEKTADASAAGTEASGTGAVSPKTESRIPATAGIAVLFAVVGVCGLKKRVF